MNLQPELPTTIRAVFPVLAERRREVRHVEVLRLLVGVLRRVQDLLRRRRERAQRLVHGIGPPSSAIASTNRCPSVYRYACSS